MLLGHRGVLTDKYGLFTIVLYESQVCLARMCIIVYRG